MQNGIVLGKKNMRRNTYRNKVDLKLEGKKKRERKKSLSKKNNDFEPGSGQYVNTINNPCCPKSPDLFPGAVVVFDVDVYVFRFMMLGIVIESPAFPSVFLMILIMLLWMFGMLWIHSLSVFVMMLLLAVLLPVHVRERG